ncbi:MAG: hypothetical protein HY814_10300 [Candidatus Riflebacteria bacterium]|nr:hypothetical protein [Candidatus Riflebacteria bacterium]
MPHPKPRHGLRARIWFGYGLILALLLMLATVMAVGLEGVAGHMAKAALKLRAAEQLRSLRRLTAVYQLSLGEVAARAPRGADEAHRLLREQLRLETERLWALVADWPLTGDSLRRYQQSLEALLEVTPESSQQAALAGRVDEVHDRWGELLSLVLTESAREVDTVVAAGRRTLWWSIAAAAAALALGGALGHVVIRRVAGSGATYFQDLRLLVADMGASWEELQSATRRQANAVASLTGAVTRLHRAASDVRGEAAEIAKMCQQSLGLSRRGVSALERNVQETAQVEREMADISSASHELDGRLAGLNTLISELAGFSERMDVASFNASLQASQLSDENPNLEKLAADIRLLSDLSSKRAAQAGLTAEQIQAANAKTTQAIGAGLSRSNSCTGLVNQAREVIVEMTDRAEETDRRMQAVSDHLATQTETVNETLRQLDALAHEFQGSHEALKAVVDAVRTVQSSLREAEETL